MDVALGTSYVSIPARNLIQSFFLFLALVLTGLPLETKAAPAQPSPMHWSGDKTLWDRKNNRVELFGHAAFHQEGETLSADYIAIDLANRTLDARGNCVYIAAGSVIYGDEMHFNLETRTGSIIGGRVVNERFTLTGQRINRLGEKRFQTHQGEYSTCRDCPEAWSLVGEDVDVEFDGYAFLKNVRGKIKDAPIVWLPYLIVPLKTQRQSGFLFPRFKITNEGFRFVQPFYWAINRSSDMTLGLGNWGGRGYRGEWEGRYRWSDRSAGTANVFYLNDERFEDFLEQEGLPAKSGRYAVSVGQIQELPFQIDQKLRIVESSDNLYPRTVGDIPGANEAYIASDISLSRTTDQVSMYVSAKRFRNLLNLASPTEFDPQTVQVLPTAVVTTNDRFLFGSPVAAGVTLGLTNFSRSGTYFDRDPFRTDSALFVPGRDPIREATRASITPALYTTLRPWDMVSLVPSAEYRGFYYSFGHGIPSLTRGYLLFRNELSTQFERVYETSNPDVPLVKHVFRPMLTYSLIPYVREPRDPVTGKGLHPFLQQIEYGNDNEEPFSGYYFDSLDIVPLDTSRTYNNYFVPIGNSLSYGFTTQLIRRKGRMDSPASSYQRSVDLRAGQTFNFRELRKKETGEEAQPLSSPFATLGLVFDQWSGNVDYSYATYAPITETEKRHVISTSFSYIFEKGYRQRILTFERSVSLGYAYNTVGGSRTQNLYASAVYSLNDYVLPSISYSYNLIARRTANGAAGLRFQSPSQCWSVDLSGSIVPFPRQREDDPRFETKVGFDLTLNLTGAGFAGFGDMASGLR